MMNIIVAKGEGLEVYYYRCIKVRNYCVGSRCYAIVSVWLFCCYTYIARNKKSERRNLLSLHGKIYLEYFYFKKLNNIPAATALPTTPATFGPIACIIK